MTFLKDFLKFWAEKNGLHLVDRTVPQPESKGYGIGHMNYLVTDNSVVRSGDLNKVLQREALVLMALMMIEDAKKMIEIVTGIKAETDLTGVEVNGTIL
jgi:hypothetical protein